MLVKTEIEKGVGVITIDHPPVNALSRQVASELLAAVEELEPDPAVRALVVTAAGRTFVAGADVREFQEMIRRGDAEQGAGLYELTGRLERCGKPVVAALFGTTLGGGLELAMACHYRMALKGTRIGQPEVKLGLIPGAGGTQRLPRLCGLVRAAEMCAGGEPVDVTQAQQWGIIDRVVDSDLRSAAIEYALLVSNDGPRPTGARNEALTVDTEAREQIDAIREAAREKYQGARASALAIDAVEKAAELPLEDGLAIENELFVQALGSEEARNLIHLFFAEREAAKVPEIKGQETYREAGRVGFPGLFSDDVGLLEALIRAEIPLRIVDRQRLTESAIDFLFLREIPEPAATGQAVEQDSAIVVHTAETFYPTRIAELGFDPAHILGLRFWSSGSPFAEIGVSEATSPWALKSLVELLKRLRCPFVVERPAPYYASARIREHRFDESDLKIEVWKLLKEKIIVRAGDVDLIQVNCFGKPRHQANIGVETVPGTG